MLLLAHLIRQHRYWNGAAIRVLRVVGRPEAVEGVRADTVRLLDAVRVEANVEVVVRGNREFNEIVNQEAAGTDLTILGLQRPDLEDVDYGERLNTLATLAGTVLLVHNGNPGEASLDAE
jgi:hypothetical protein